MIRHSVLQKNAWPSCCGHTLCPHPGSIRTAVSPTNAANFSTVYGGLTSAAIFFFWIYYGAIVFILGGEVAQVYTMHRTRRLHASNPVLPVNG